MIGWVHLPHPGASLQTGLSICAGSQSPSISSSQSSGFSALGSGTVSDSSSNQPSGISASSSMMVRGSDSSQSSGFSAFGSGIFSRSSQFSGFLSLGSSISAGGLTGGLKSYNNRWQNFLKKEVIKIRQIPFGFYLISNQDMFITEYLLWTRKTLKFLHMSG